MGKHAEWRKVVKKLRRKRIRTMIAVERDQKLFEEQKKREQSPTYKAWLEEQKLLEEFNAAEEKRLAMQRQKIWEIEEEAALLRWREQQSRLAHAKADKFKKEMMIKEEWEREQKKLQDAEEARKKIEDERKRKQAELLAQIDAFIEGRAELPEEVNVSTETQPGHPECPFFSKTGACRFKESCSRNHVRPGISKTLLLPNFYDHFGMQTLRHHEYDTDIGLEYDDNDSYQNFKEFYFDVLPEFEQLGKVVQFKVCNNEEPHLRGNVYVEFKSRRHSLKAYRKFQGRFYAGRRLNVEFTTIPSWKNAICGLFHRQKCPKGKTCNFLHIFRNPNNAFKIQDGHSSSRRQFSRSRSKSPRHRSRSKEWNWSDGSDSDSGRRRRRSRSRSRVRSRKYDSDSEDDQRSRSPRRSRVRSRYRSRSRERDGKWKEVKDRKRGEKYQSSSRSPQRESKWHKDDSRDDRKSYQNEYKSETEISGKEDSSKIYQKRKDRYDRDISLREESFKQSKKYKDDDKKKSSDYRDEKEPSNGKEDSSKHYRKSKDDDRRKSSKYTYYEKEVGDRKHKKDKSDDSERKSKKRSSDEYQSTSKSLDSDCNEKEHSRTKKSVTDDL